jgi:hypothetical protein
LAGAIAGRTAVVGATEVTWGRSLADGDVDQRSEFDDFGT